MVSFPKFTNRQPKPTETRRVEANTSVFTFHFPFDPEVKDAVKAITGSKFYGGSKTWTAPLTSSAEVKAVVEKFNFIPTNIAIDAMAATWRPGMQAVAPDRKEAPSTPRTSSIEIVRSQFHIRLAGDNFSQLVEGVRDIPGRRYNGKEKYWSAPITSVRSVIDFARRFNIDMSTLEEVPDAQPVIEPTISKIGNDYVIQFPADRDLSEWVGEISTARYIEDLKGYRVSASAKFEVAKFARDANAVYDPEQLEDEMKVLQAQLARIEMSRAHDADLVMPTLDGELRPFQRAGVVYALDSMGFELHESGEWRYRSLYPRGGVLIGDEQGLGKTVQAIAVLEATQSFPAVVVAPASLRRNWTKEIARFLPHRSVERIEGSKPKRLEADITVVSWESLHGHADHALPCAVVFDELHRAKNPKARMTKAAITLADRVRSQNGISIGLTGTPVLNRPSEVAAQLRILGRLDEFGGESGFELRYVKSDEYRAELNDQMRAKCFVRRLKKEVLTELPPKVHVVLDLDGDPDLMDEYHILQQGLSDEVEQIARKAEEASGSTDDLIRQAAVDQALQTESGSFFGKLERLTQIAADAKMPEIEDWIEEFLETGKKLVVFARHRKIVNAIADKYGNGCKIQGGMSDKQKQECIDKFQNDDSQKVIACSIKAGGVGHTLTAASDVLFIEQGWNPADQDQAADRCHRMGQRDSVTVYTSICIDTIDEGIYNVIENKRKVVDEITDGVARPIDDPSFIAQLLQQLRQKRN